MPKSGLFRTARWIGILGAFVVAEACDNPSGLRELNGVSIYARDQQVVVTNNSASAIFTTVVGRNAEARVDYIWPPCVDVVRCHPIQPGEARAHPYGTLILDPGEKEVIVHWWHAVPDGSGVPQAGDFGYLIVPLH
jgi:hypothetical protein